MMNRIQRRRTRGWTMPAGCIYVGRPTKWGNPYVLDDGSDPEMVIGAYRIHLESELKAGTLVLADLRGHDLACWCPLDALCHADVLIEFVLKDWMTYLDIPAIHIDADGARAERALADSIKQRLTELQIRTEAFK